MIDRALVTGASECLGGRLAEMLAGRGTEVTVLARPGADLGHLRGMRVRVVRGSVAQFAAVRDAMRGCTHVFHCAGLRTEWAAERSYFETNVLGTGMLLEAAKRERSVRRFVFASTTDVYGFPKQVPAEGVEPERPRLAYGRTMLQAETAVWGYGDEGVPVSVIRLATVFGPRSREAVMEIVRLLRARRLPLIDGGRARGGFCYVDNAACALIKVCEAEQTAGQAYNVTDGTGVSWREYVTGLAEELRLRAPGLELPFGVAMAMAGAAELAHAGLGLLGRPLLTRQTVYAMGRDREFPHERAAKEFGYKPGVGFAEGMRRTSEWVRSVDAGAEWRP